MFSKVTKGDGGGEARKLQLEKVKVVQFKRVKHLVRTKTAERLIGIKGKEKILHHSPHEKGFPPQFLYNSFEALGGEESLLGGMEDEVVKGSSDIEEFVPLSL